MLACLDASATHFDVDRKIPSGSDHYTSVVERYYYFLSDLSVPTFQSVTRRYILLHVRLEQAGLAVALERFRLSRGEYPSALAELVPDFLPEVPRDIYSGQPFRYHQTEAGSFVLYSFGPDRHDDGGKFDRAKRENDQRDIIWLYAPAERVP